jgi:uroporphyrinogen-III synthase
MRVLITRPAEDAPSLAEAVRARGHEPLIAPLSIIRYESPDPPQEMPSATIFTSRNAVRALAGLDWVNHLHALPAYCVGPATAQAAREAGFTHIIGGGGTGAQLAEHIAYAHTPDAGPLLYLTGDHLAFDMQGALGERGFTVCRRIVYRSDLVAGFSAEVHAALQAGDVDAVMLMSPRAASHFAALAQTSGLTAQAARLCYFCLSEAVAHALAPLGAAHINIAPRPTQEALIDLLGPSSAV